MASTKQNKPQEMVTVAADKVEQQSSNADDTTTVFAPLHKSVAVMLSLTYSASLGMGFCKISNIFGTC